MYPSTDRSANYFVGMLRSYQVPNFSETPQERSRKQTIKKMILKRALITREASKTNLESPLKEGFVSERTQALKTQR
jgi:hypothetical protein